MHAPQALCDVCLITCTRFKTPIYIQGNIEAFSISFAQCNKVDIETLNVRCTKLKQVPRAPDKACIFISITPIVLPNPMFDHLLESSHRDDSNKWSNIGFGEEITPVELIEVHFMHLIWSSGVLFDTCSSAVQVSRGHLPRN